MIVGGYTLNLYCDCGRRSLDNDPSQRVPYQTPGHDDKPGEYTGHTHNECVARARRDGWTFKQDGRVLSPWCKKNGGKLL